MGLCGRGGLNFGLDMEDQISEGDFGKFKMILDYWYNLDELYDLHYNILFKSSKVSGLCP